MWRGAREGDAACHGPFFPESSESSKNCAVPIDSLHPRQVKHSKCSLSAPPLRTCRTSPAGFAWLSAGEARAPKPETLTLNTRA